MAKQKKKPKQDLPLGRLISIIRSSVGNAYLPSVSRISRQKKDPFKILVSTILSLRTKDEVTAEASRRLFLLASSASSMARLSLRSIEKAIYPVGFYRIKARNIKNIAIQIEKNGGIVPDSIEELLKLKGVGRKTANLVVTLAYGKPGICVDTHVHRVSNRLGIVEAKTPEHTEFALMGILPKKYWIEINELLVSFGQLICRPVSPYCSECKLFNHCPRVGVKRHR